MKKTVSLCLVILLLTVLLAGCAAQPSEPVLSSGAASSDSREILLVGSGDEPSKSNAVSSPSLGAANGGYRIYLRINGTVQGEIHGDYKLSGDKKDLIRAESFTEGVTVPTEESGLVIGRHLYKPASFVHAVDAATVPLRRAVVSGERLTVTVDFYRINSAGLEEKYFSILYTDATVIGMSLFTDENGNVFEDVSFSFSEVTYSYAEPAAEYHDYARR